MGGGPYTVTAVLDNGSGVVERYEFGFVVEAECDAGREWKRIYWPDRVRQLDVEKFTIPDELQAD